MIKAPTTATLALCLLTAVFAAGAAHGASEVNLYTSRHYDVDDKLYDKFTAETGIEVNLVVAKANALLERLKREGYQTAAVVSSSGAAWLKSA